MEFFRGMSIIKSFDFSIIGLETSFLYLSWKESKKKYLFPFFLRLINVIFWGKGRQKCLMVSWSLVVVIRESDLLVTRYQFPIIEDALKIGMQHLLFLSEISMEQTKICFQKKKQFLQKTYVRQSLFISF